MKIVLLVYIVCLVYKLSITSVVICSVAAIIYNVFYEKQEKIRKYYLNKYYDVVQYMEQMIYSFKKQPKIREAYFIISLMTEMGIFLPMYPASLQDNMRLQLPLRQVYFHVPSRSYPVRYICLIPPAYHPKYTLPVTRT